MPVDVTMRNRLNVALDATPCSSKYRSFEVAYDFQLKSIRLPNDGEMETPPKC